MLPTILRTRNHSFPNLVDEIFAHNLFPRFFDLTTVPENNWVPSVNVEESESEYRIAVAAPGIDKEDFKVSVNEGVLTIAYEKKTESEEKTERLLRREFGTSSFRRAFTLPEQTDTGAIKAEHKNGILEISIPKTEVKTAPSRVINVI